VNWYDYINLNPLHISPVNSTRRVLLLLRRMVELQQVEHS